MTPNDVKTVADNIDDYIEVPNSIERIRTAILALAVTGKFAPEGSLRWGSSTLGEMCSVKKGRKPELSETGGSGKLPYLEAKFIRGSKQPQFASISDKNSIMVNKDDVIIICDGSNSGEFFAGVEGVLASTMGVLEFDKKLITKEYLQVFLESNFELFNKARKGAAIPHLDFNLFNSLTFPLPSVEEQKRIVKKVEEVTKQLDELEAKKQERDETRTRLARSAMQLLGKGESKIAFEQLTELIKTPADLKELEDALLTLAVSGRLVPQDKKEGTAEDLFAKIQKTSGDQKKKARELLPITSKDIPFEIPKSWKYIYIHEVADFITKGTTPKTYGHNFTTEGVPFLRAENVQNREINVDAVTHHISSETNDFLSRSKTKSGDILLTIAGTIGKTAIVRKEMPEMNMNQAVAIIRLKELVFPDFLALLFRSEIIQIQIRAGTVKMAIPNFSLTMIKNLFIPLPPLAEQKRIVKKVEEVMTLVEQLRGIIDNKKPQTRGRPKNK